MSDNQVARWEREIRAEAMAAELYLAGTRAGAKAASTQWPLVERQRLSVLSKGMRATIGLFGTKAAVHNQEYCAGWIDGYTLYCDERDERAR
jgi:hypothetical protein